MHPTFWRQEGKALRDSDQHAIEKQGYSPHRDALVGQNHRAVLHCPKHQPIQTVWVG